MKTRKKRTKAIHTIISGDKSCKLTFLILSFLTLLFFISILPFNAFAIDDKNKRDRYTFGVFPYLAAKQLGNSYGPVAAEFSKILEQKVNFTSTPSYEDFSKGLTDERFDIAMIQPFDYANAVDKHNYLPLARVDADLRAHFVVKADSKYNNLNDLKGTRIALPSASAAISRVSIQALKKNGFEIDHDITLKHFKSFGSCLQNVLIGYSSSCASGLAAKKIFEARMNVKLKTIYITPAIPHMTFVVHKRMAKKDREILKNTIINWKNTRPGQEIIKGTRLPGFRVVDDRDYNVIREFDD